MAILALGASSLNAAIRKLTGAEGAQSLQSLWQKGIGSEDVNSVINVPRSGLASTALLANLLQLLLTLIYLAYNNLFTRKEVANEWTRYGQRALPLRVTDPRGAQRSSYYLGLPFRYAIPLQLGSLLLNWLASQSLYVINIFYFDYMERPAVSQRIRGSNMTGAEYYAIGYSCIGIILTLTLGVVLLFIGWIDDFRRFKTGIPLVGTCSAAISANCHSIHQHPKEMVLKPLKWGVVSIRNGVSHCAFSDHIDSVVPPSDGELCRSEVVNENSSDNDDNRPLSFIRRRLSDFHIQYA